MLTHLIDYPVINGKKNVPVDDAHEKKIHAYFSRDFEIQEPENQEIYYPQSSLTHNHLNLYVVDWEIPKAEY